MADAVAIHTLFNGIHRGERVLELCLTNLSDGSGESAVNKLDISTLRPAVDQFDVVDIQYSVFGMAVALYWDHTTDEPIAVLQGSGRLSFNECPGGGLVDPQGPAVGADLLLTTTGHSAADSYTITLKLRLRNSTVGV